MLIKVKNSLKIMSKILKLCKYFYKLNLINKIILPIGIRSFSNLSFFLFGETNNEASKNGTVHSLNFTYRFDERLPFSNERAKFISGHIHTIK